jgi:outer membrane protein assembly factor BamA
MLRIWIAVLFAGFGWTSFGQVAPANTTHPGPLIRKSSFLAIPILYYTPETRWAGGAAALYTYRTRMQSDSIRPSQLQLGFAYTQEHQILSYLPFQLFFKQEQYQANGELGYYQYVYEFYGIGNNTPKAAKEAYSINYPRLRLNLLGLVAPHQYLGIRYWWDNYQIVKTAKGGLIDAGNLTGSKGGVVSGAGLVWNFDNRNQIFYPTSGFFAEAELFDNSKALGSNFNFTRISLDATGYFPVSEKSVLALNAWLVLMQGDPPFQQLAFIGGSKKMRGYFEGRLRDKNLWMLQPEYRTPLFGRWGAVVFGGMGAVSSRLGNLFGQQIHLTYGAGLRFRISKKDLINLRLDVAANEYGEISPYLTVKEAF